VLGNVVGNVAVFGKVLGNVVGNVVLLGSVVGNVHGNLGPTGSMLGNVLGNVVVISSVLGNMAALGSVAGNMTTPSYITSSLLGIAAACGDGLARRWGSAGQSRQQCDHQHEADAAWPHDRQEDQQPIGLFWISFKGCRGSRQGCLMGQLQAQSA